MLIACDRVEDAAEKAGITRNTIYAWMQQEEFSRALSEERKKIYDTAMHKMINTCMKAVNTLEKLLDAESEAVRRNAANDVIGHIIKYRELAGIEERLESVEKIVLEKRKYKPCKN
jgi:transposase-like protein